MAADSGHGRIRIVMASLLTAAALAGCGQQQSKSAIPTGEQQLARLRKENPEANRLLHATPAAFKRRVRAAGGPLVVNQWASWCGPCRYEFPHFQRLAERYRGKVAFLGVDAKYSSADARKFLAKYPTPYAPLEDPTVQIARLFRGGRYWPTTAFYDARGDLAYTHSGAYRDESALDADIKRYALAQ